MGEAFYKLWRGVNDPSWFSLSNAEQERWETFASAVFEEFAPDLVDPDEGGC